MESGMTDRSGHQSEILHKSGADVFEIITLFLRWLDPLNGKLVQTAYGINTSKVRELVAMPDKPTAIPDSPPSVKGVFLLRDRTIPLIDLCEWFGYEGDSSSKTQEGTVVVITEINTKVYGFIVHGVDKVHRVTWEDIRNPPDIIAQQSSITGVCLLGGAIIQMIDFEKIIASIDPSSTVKEPNNNAVPDDVEQRGKRVLVAEDSKTAQKQLSNLLASSGYEVSLHSNGQSCWEWLEAARERGRITDEVAAVITDIEMPQMDGLQLCSRIKAQPAYNAIPVVIFSSLINETVRHRVESVGADDQLSKTEIDKLPDRLQACIEAKK
jgi:two-component system chemotaxis response regulator CheV